MGMFTRVEDIVGLEVTEFQDVATVVGPQVEGHLLVRAYLSSAPSGTFFWVAADSAQEAQLLSFYSVVLDAYASRR